MFLQAMHAPHTNPVRLVTVDTAAGTITTAGAVQLRPVARPVGEQDVEEVHPYSTTLSGMRWVAALSSRPAPQPVGSVTSATSASRARTTSSAATVAATP